MSEKSAKIEFLRWEEESNFGVWNLEISGLDERVNIKFFNLVKEKSNLGIGLTPMAYIPTANKEKVYTYRVKCENRKHLDLFLEAIRSGDEFYLSLGDPINETISDIDIKDSSS
jgi:hypothetical protein